MVASWTYPEGSPYHYSRIILRDLRVLKASSTPAAEQLTSSSDGHAVTLAVTDVQVQKLYWAMQNGEVAPGAAPAGQGRGQPREPRKRALAPARGHPPGRARRCRAGGEPMSENTRIYVTGSCDGLDQLREGLATHPEIDFVGWSEHVGEATPALAGGHLQVVVHATRETTLPGDRGRRDPRADAGARRRPRLGRVVGAARRRARRRGRRRRPAAAAADRERRLRAAQGGARGPPARHRRRARPPRAHRHGLLAEGRDGQDGDRDEPRRVLREEREEAHAPARPRPPVRGRLDHARARAGEDDLRLRRRPGRARLREARGLRDPSTRAGSTSCRRRCARRTPSS